jgi:hypothetical protein
MKKTSIGKKILLRMLSASIALILSLRTFGENFVYDISC